MKLFKRKKPLAPPVSKEKALMMKPVKQRDILESRQSNGDIMLSYPLRIRSSFLPFFKVLGYKNERPQMKKLQLDTLGTFVWELIDGRRTIHDIICTLSKKYHLMEVESEVSVTQFIRLLGQKGLIGLTES